MKCLNPRLTHEYGRGWVLCFDVDSESTGLAKLVVDKYKDGYVDLSVDRWSDKRSLQANAYMWVLVDKIAQKTRQKPVDVYRHLIKDIPGNSTLVCVQNKAKDVLQEQWQAKGLGWQTDELPSKIDGCTNILLYYGSSVYNATQMSLLIDTTVDEAKELGIETLTPFELEGMKAAWK